VIRLAPALLMQSPLMKSLLFCSLLGACVIDTVPLPEDNPRDPGLPGITTQGVNSDAMYYANGAGLLVGAEGAVGGRGTVVVENAARQDWRGQVTSHANGSFAMPIHAEIGDEVLVSFIVGERLAAQTTYEIEPPSVDAVDASQGFADPGGAPDVEAGNFMVSAPDAQGFVTVWGTEGSVAAAIDVIVANIDSGAATSASARGDGSFTARLPGTSGDELRLFAVEPATSNTGGVITVVFVQ
jgi:hypothetical protein